VHDDDDFGGKCEDLLPQDCGDLLSFQGEAKLCDKRYEGGIDADPTARGERINFGPCKAAGRDGYKYGAVAYAGGKVVDGKVVPGCCPKTCGQCSASQAATPTATEATPTMATPGTNAQPEAVLKPMPVEVPQGDPNCMGEMWCREWNVEGSWCKEEHSGRFFDRALTTEHKFKTKKFGRNFFPRSEVHGRKIEGWCCWPPEPKFPGPSGSCGLAEDLQDYYPSGNFCEQDFTCPKLYLLETFTPKGKPQGCYPVEKTKQECCAKPPCDDHYS